MDTDESSRHHIHNTSQKEGPRFRRSAHAPLDRPAPSSSANCKRYVHHPSPSSSSAQSDAKFAIWVSNLLACEIKHSSCLFLEYRAGLIKSTRHDALRDLRERRLGVIASRIIKDGDFRQWKRILHGFLGLFSFHESDISTRHFPQILKQSN